MDLSCPIVENRPVMHYCGMINETSLDIQGCAKKLVPGCEKSASIARARPEAAATHNLRSTCRSSKFLMPNAVVGRPGQLG